MSAYCEVPLGRSGLVALVDESDYELVAGYSWQAHRTRSGRDYHARRRWCEGGRQRTQFMHALLVGAGCFVDHRNHNGLDNRRENLRCASGAENARNRRSHLGSTSRFKGVYWAADRRLWRAGIRYEGRLINLGSFADEVAAAKAYDATALKLHGDFVCPNFELEKAA